MMRLKLRNTPISTTMDWGAGFPLPMLESVSRTISGYPTAMPSDVFLVRFRHWLMNGGMETRAAWGSSTWRYF